MKTSLSTLLLAAALGSLAHPSGHGHQHFHRALTQYTKSVPPSNDIADKKSAPVPPSPKEDDVLSPVSAPAAPAISDYKDLQPTLPNKQPEQSKPTKESSHSGASFGDGPESYTDFCSDAKSKRATVAQVFEAGNLGNGKYGCNLMLVKSHYADKYDYTVRFVNDGGHRQECVCWLKMGPDGKQLIGFFEGHQVLTFNVDSKAEQYLAIQADTKGGCSCYKNKVPTVPSIGQFASTWLEFDMGSKANGGCSGADASSLAAHAAGMDVPGMQVCDAARPYPQGNCSTIYAGGKGNALSYPGGTADMDGLSVNLNPGPAHYVVKIDYQEPAPADAISPKR
ncbi:hypothetical protein XA68_14424 [Ophiocordyceps unilateralis]|uniref:Allergen Asp f 4 n=1 Tax=Ophiocordyceps unilateralis TaxID=268505 RepID=A0A2A9PAH6_OPHUN|nr:hypothetical protein XA68_14424 [Ophiocordyceps unilateralis]